MKLSTIAGLHSYTTACLLGVKTRNLDQFDLKYFTARIRELHTFLDQRSPITTAVAPLMVMLDLLERDIALESYLTNNSILSDALSVQLHHFNEVILHCDSDDINVLHAKLGQTVTNHVVYDLLKGMAVLDKDKFANPVPKLLITDELLSTLKTYAPKLEVVLTKLCSYALRIAKLSNWEPFNQLHCNIALYVKEENVNLTVKVKTIEIHFDDMIIVKNFFPHKV